nr:hypothetical protein [Tanacetum cinerariifolium]
MVALRYKEEHNKVGYLLKPTGSDDYHQIIDFLRDSHIRKRRKMVASVSYEDQGGSSAPRLIGLTSLIALVGVRMKAVHRCLFSEYCLYDILFQTSQGWPSGKK